MASLSREFVLFAGVGVVGFVVDAAVFTLALAAAPLLAARLAAFAAAVTTTFVLNRLITFRNVALPSLPAAYAKFVASNAAGGLVNMAVSIALVAADLGALSHPVIAVACGAASGLVFNFTLSRWLVFAAPRQ